MKVSLIFRILTPVAAIALISLGASRRDSSPANSIENNDNTHAAGVFRDNILTVRLDARKGMWLPEGDTGPHITTAAFAEEGKAPQAPGPLIRVPAGAEIHAAIRNSLEKPLWINGMGATRGLNGDSAVIAPGATREFRFIAKDPGLFYYTGRTDTVPVLFRGTEDPQLNGAIIVDPPAKFGKTHDRIFVITQYFSIVGPKTVSGLGPDATLAFNGGSWPGTERITTKVGDTLNWKFINVTGLEHPLHLHGAYFHVESKGDGVKDTTFAFRDQRMVVTDIMFPGQTLGFHWTPLHSGNWIFHCHFASHITPRDVLEMDRKMPDHPMHTEIDASMHRHMQGLVIGIRVNPNGPTVRSTAAARPIRIIVRSRANVYGEHVGYSFVASGSPAELKPDSLPVPGPTLYLTKGKRVAVTIVNQSHEPAAIHWHGIELESFPDGVPGWSGSGKDILPMVRSHDSLTVYFTPPRSGTFIYHSHFNENQQIASGLYGALLVVDPGVRTPPVNERVLLFSDDGPQLNFFTEPPPPALLNGELHPAPMQLTAGQSYRFRIINIRTDFMMSVLLRNGDKPLEWRVVAKDGADLPSRQIHASSTPVILAPGETYDVEVVPTATDKLVLDYGLFALPGEAPPEALARHTVAVNVK